jgi:hypothetical protein
VRRDSDGAKQNFGFDGAGNLDVEAIESWLSGSDGELVTWYSQLDGVSDLEAGGSGDPPLIAQGGAVLTGPSGNPRIYIHTGPQVGLKASSQSFPHDDFSLLVVGEVTGNGSEGGTFFHTRTPVYTDYKPQEHSWLLNSELSDGTSFRDESIGAPWGTAIYSLSMGSGGIEPGYNDESIETFSANPQSGEVEWFDLFYRSTNQHGSTGYVSEVTIYPSFDSDQDLYDRYDNMNSYWEVGPVGTNREAILPQRQGWHITLYDWIETLDEGDVSIPEGTIRWDGIYSDIDELADLWLQVKGVSASSVTRSEPGWYVLDNGNGKGIEATGTVKNVDEPKGSGGYYGNPPRSWSNEPAFLYQLDISLSGGGQGNPWYQNSAMGRRALVVSMVDMMMHSITPGFSRWTDMHGKALLAWAEVYKWCKSELPPDALVAYEKGMEYSLDLIIDRGARAVNTNMDMFAMKAAAEIYAATDNSALQDKALKAVRRTLLGNTDATHVGGPNHEVFAAGGGYENGVFHPAGFIMEGDQPDVFYGGESMYHLAGALQAVRDRDTGNVPSEWSFLEEIVQRIQEWRTHQMFYDPAVAAGGLPDGPAQVITAGAGFSGRTGAGVPAGQSGEEWKYFSVAEIIPNSAFIAAQGYIGITGEVPTASDMESDINDRLSYIDGEMDDVYTDSPADWQGWSPWSKHTPYLPPDGWFSELQTLANNDDPTIEKIPAARSGTTWNKTFGGPPTGDAFWSYKGEDANGEPFGFFVEAMPRQGGYGGWYGGKIETFWTESTGVVLINRHGKGGCDDNFEDSVCWDQIDERAAHHVWGRDENGNGFTTLLLRGRDIQRTSTFNTSGSPPTVTVNNVFNDPNHSETTKLTGEQTGSEIEGEFEVENKFEVQSNGLKVTHTLTSDASDQVNELWTSLPVHLRSNNPERGGDDAQRDLEDTSIEYWGGSSWQTLPEDTGGDGVPEIVTTSALRLGRDYSSVLDQPIAYAYVSFTSDQDVRRSMDEYYDPYQTTTGVRTVHIDLHGDPGATKTLPAEKSVSYTLQTTDPTTEEGTSTSQVIPLQKGWNIVSTSVSPAASAMDSVFAALQSEITVVKNEAGERYRPAENINEVGQWSSKEAYRVHAESDVMLAIKGDPLGSPSIALEQGWNLVPYFPSSPLSVEEAVSSITEDLGPVKDEAGRVYLPEEDPDVLEQMEPGEGYRIYVHQATTLTYPEGGN